jgi:hypothetical protein
MIFVQDDARGSIARNALANATRVTPLEKVVFDTDPNAKVEDR